MSTTTKIRTLAVTALFCAASGLAAAGPAGAAVCTSGVAGDVNGDGHAEAAVGEPFDGGDQSGAVHVLYGTVAGLVADASGAARNDQLFTQATPGVPGTDEPGDTLGDAALLADFDGDGCADLAVGASGENANTGQVVVLYGSPGGLTTTGAQWFSESSLFGGGSSQGGETFGAALATGDLDDDGIADLVVGAPGERLDGNDQVGGVAVVYGGSGGLDTGSTSAGLFTQDTVGIPGGAEDGDGFGSSVAAGDVDGDGVDDLVVGVPGENGVGVVQVLPGEAGAGVGGVTGSSYSQNTAGVPGAAEPGDRFGAAVAAGDVNGDGRGDVAVGVPGENGTPSGPEPFGEGAVTFLPGSAAGLTGTGSQFWSQATLGVEGIPANHDSFGAALVIAPLDNGPLADLAIGVPFDDVGSTADAGSVNILLGSASGLSTIEAGGSRFHQGTSGIAGGPEPDDQFGRSVAAPLVQTPDQASLLIGVPTEGIGVEGTGIVHQLATFEFGPNPIDSRSFHLDTPGLKGAPDGGDLFGFSLG